MDLEEKREGKLRSGYKINKEITGKVWFCHNNANLEAFCGG